MKSPLLTTSFAILAGLLLSAASQQESVAQRFHNPTLYDVHVAFGFNKDSSIAGIGGNGYDDPNPYVATTFWYKIPAGSSIAIPTFGKVKPAYVRVQTGNRNLIGDEKGGKWFPMRNDHQGGKIVLKKFSNGPVGNRRFENIRKRGWTPKKFTSLYALKSGSKNFSIRKKDVERFQNATGRERVNVICITNASDRRVTYDFRWGPKSQWQRLTLEPRRSRIYWIRSAKVDASIRFDEGINAPGTQLRQNRLRPFKADIRIGEKPTKTSASNYEFQISGTRRVLVAR